MKVNTKSPKQRIRGRLRIVLLVMLIGAAAGGFYVIKSTMDDMQTAYGKSMSLHEFVLSWAHNKDHPYFVKRKEMLLTWTLYGGGIGLLGSAASLFNIKFIKELKSL